MKLLKRLLVITIFIFFVSCSTLQNKGYYINIDDIDLIKPSITHKHNVIKILGDPSYRIDDDTYLYYSYKIKPFGILRSKTYDEQILLITFDNEGITKDKVYKQNKISEFKANQHASKIYKDSKSFFREILKNLELNLKQ